MRNLLMQSEHEERCFPHRTYCKLLTLDMLSIVLKSSWNWNFWQAKGHSIPKRRSSITTYA